MSAPAVPSKPIAWWIMQAIMVPAVPALLVGGVQLADWAGRQTSRGDGSIGSVILGCFVFFALWACAIALTTWRRMPVARLIGGAFIALLILLSLALFPVALHDVGADPSVSVLVIPAIALVAIGACCWLYAFAFSPRVKRYLGLA